MATYTLTATTLATAKPNGTTPVFNVTHLFTAVALSAASPTIGAPALVIPAPDLALGSAVLDSGFSQFATCNVVHLCNQHPSSYADVLAMSLGSKSGVSFGAIQASAGSERKVSSGLVIAGSTTGNGNATRWAAVDSNGGRLLATGVLAAPVPLTIGNVWTLQPIVIHMPETPVSNRVTLQATPIAAGAAVVGTIAVKQKHTLSATALSGTAPAFGTPIVGSGARLLLASGFEGISLGYTQPEGQGAEQYYIGTDSVTGFVWPNPNTPSSLVWGADIHHLLQAGVDVTPQTLPNYIINRMETVTGHTGAQTQALYSELHTRGNSWTQNPFMLQPDHDITKGYISFWIKFQADLQAKMTPQNWRSIFEIKTGGDYRVIVYVASWDVGCNSVKPNGPMYWRMQGDNEANGGLPYQEFWHTDNCQHAIPVNTWCKLEFYWYRNFASPSTCRFWFGVDGYVVLDRTGSLIGVNQAATDRIMMPNLYSDSLYPIYQWVDQIEIWDDFPPATGGNPPYAPH